MSASDGRQSHEVAKEIIVFYYAIKYLPTYAYLYIYIRFYRGTLDDSKVTRDSANGAVSRFERDFSNRGYDKCVRSVTTMRIGRGSQKLK